MAEQPEVFGEDGRPGGLFDMLVSPLGPAAPPTATLQAHDILSQLLMSLSHIWPTAQSIDSIAVDGSDLPLAGDPAHALGDCWRHSAVRGPGLTNGWMPFHKLSQWLTYSLIEPFEWAGVRVGGLEALTALPEYRNGGLLIDSGVIVPRDAAMLERTWQVGDECIVEWRALTVALLDELAPRLRTLLQRDEAQLPLALHARGRHLGRRPRAGTAAAQGRCRRCASRATARCSEYPCDHTTNRTALFMTSGNDNVHLIDHPLVQHKLTLMRSKEASTNSFRRLLNELAMLMAYEVTRDMPMQDVEIETPLETMTGEGDRRQEAGVRLDPARRHRHPRRHAHGGAGRARRPHRPVPRPQDAGRGRVLLQDAGRHARARRGRGRPDAGHRQLGHRGGGAAEGGCGPSRSSSCAC